MTLLLTYLYQYFKNSFPYNENSNNANHFIFGLRKKAEMPFLYALIYLSRNPISALISLKSAFEFSHELIL